ANLALTPEDEDEAKRFFDAFKNKRVQYVNGIIGGPLRLDKAKEFSKKFWEVATKGITLGDQWYLCPLSSAAWIAFASAYPEGEEVPAGITKGFARLYSKETGTLLLYVPQ
ncbi:MAG: hypothetical protein ACPLSK_05875, partial [bacterium]